MRHLTSLGACLVAAATLAACGNNSEAIQQAKQDAAAQQKIKDKQHELETQIADLKKVRKASDGGTNTVTVTTQSDGPGTSTDVSGSSGQRTFHAPTGNVSCQVSTSSATCSVASIGVTFVLDSTGPGREENGVRLPRGSGYLTPFGSSVSAGSVTCVIPPVAQPRGIACVDSHTGHGFEASRIPARQKFY